MQIIRNSLFSLHKNSFYRVSTDELQKAIYIKNYEQYHFDFLMSKTNKFL